MIFYAAPNLVVSIYLLTLAVLVLRANPRSSVNRWFFFHSFFSFIWLFSYGLMYLSDTSAAAAAFGKIGHIAAIIIVPSFNWFILSVLGRYTRPREKLVALFASGAAFAAVIAALYFPNYFIGVSERPWGYYPIGGKLMLAYTAWTFILAARLTYLILRSAIQAHRELNYQDFLKYKFYAFSIVIYLFACVDFLPKFRFDIYPCGYLFVGIYSSLITYAIVRHKLLDVEIIVKRSFLYSLLVSVMTMIYFSLIFLSEQLFRTYIGYRSFFAALVASAVIALLFNPLRTRIQAWLDRTFFHIDPEVVVNENKMLKAAIESQDRLRSVATLAAGMAHEIKNPLTSIRTFAEYLPEKYNDPDFRNKFKKIVVDEVDRVNSIVQQLLDFSKPKEPELKKVSVVEILDETLGLITSRLLDAKVTLSREYRAAPEILADRHQLKQAFLNLFLNSIQSMPAGGNLEVGTALSDSGRLVISISDTGVGIPRENQSHIFDPFYTTKDGGTGLGLSIVHSIITKHGGKLEVESEVGKGTTIRAVLRSRR